MYMYANPLSSSHDSGTATFYNRVFDCIPYKGLIFGKQRLEQIFAEWGGDSKAVLPLLGEAVTVLSSSF